MSLEKSWYIDPLQPVFEGHFPGNPILPGVLVIGFLKVLMAEHFGRPVTLAAVKRQKFMKPVLPEQTLTLSVKTIEEVGDLIHLTYAASVADDTIAKGSLSLRMSAGAEHRNEA